VIHYSLVSAINQWARLTPQVTACIDGPAQLTWADFSRCVLAAIELLPTDRHATVGIVAGNNAEHMIMACAVIATGRVLQTFPVDVTDEVLAVLIKRSGVTHVGVDHANRVRCQALNDIDVKVIGFCRTQVKGLGHGKPVVIPDLSPCGADDLSIVFSSGTTGLPKGIVHSANARKVVAEAVSGLGLNRQAVNLVSLAMHNNLSMVTWLSALWNGACNVLLPTFDPVALGEAALRHQATHLVMSPIHYRQLLGAQVDYQVQFASLRLHICSSSRLYAWEKQAVVQTMPGRFVEIYGVTEGGVGTLLDCSADPKKLHTVGKPLSIYDVRIIDEAGREVAANVVGNIVGRSEFMMSRYASHDLMESWAPPTSDDDMPRFIVPGDLGYLDSDGYLVVCDRAKDALLADGEYVFPSQIESFIASTFMPIDVAVKVHADDSGRLGFVVIHLVPPLGMPVPFGGIVAQVNAHFGLGGRVKLKRVDAIPRNGMGKILRHLLTSPANTITV